MFAAAASKARFILNRGRVVGLAAAQRQQRAAFAEMPTPQSAHAKLFEGHAGNEGWEFTVAWWYSSSFVLICGILMFTPETEIDAWAKKEAMARLEMKEKGLGEPEFGKHYQGASDAELKSAWDVFSQKALRMTEDDDDDDDDDEDEDDEE